MCLLEKVICYATECHSGQVDKCGEPYILHPLRVMMSLSHENERILAVLHDVLEDTKADLNYLKNTIVVPAHILESLEFITKKKNENYFKDFLPRIARNDLAYNVKIADINDNLRQERLNKLSIRERLYFYEKYNRALDVLCNAR